MIYMSNNSKKSSPILYYHVGMGKIASTYLREVFFPNLHGAYYIPRRRKFDAVEIMKEGNYSKYILCRALDTNMEDGIQDIGKAYPNTHPIILFREPGSWISSQYRRWVKNGFPGTLQDFMDVKNNQGFWPREELLFMRKIQLLEKYFKPKPLVLFYQDLKEDPKAFFDKIANYTGCTYDFNTISLQPVHKGHAHKGLVFRRHIKRWFSNQMTSYTKIPILHWWHRRLGMVWAYLLIALGNRLPESWLPKEPFIDPDYLKDIQAYTKEDWNTLKAYASNVEDEIS